MKITVTSKVSVFTVSVMHKMHLRKRWDRVNQGVSAPPTELATAVSTPISNVEYTPRSNTINTPNTTKDSTPPTQYTPSHAVLTRHFYRQS